MTRLAWLALATTVAVTGCGRTGEGTPVAPTATTQAAVIRTVELAPSSTGLLLTATAVAPTQGYWNATLVPRATEVPGQLAFDFVAVPPPGPAPVLTERSREITVATYLSPRDLAGIREISVSTPAVPGQSASRIALRAASPLRAAAWTPAARRDW